MVSDEELWRIKKTAQDKLFRIPGVRAVAIGHKFSGGKNTGVISIVIKVEKKRPLSEVPASERIPAEIEGIPTDILEWKPRILAVSTVDDTAKERPVLGGVLIILDAPNGSEHRGTLGFIAQTDGSVTGIAAGAVVGVTCMHVVSDDGTPTGTLLRDVKIGQPTTCDCSKCCSSCYDIIGKVRYGVGVDGSGAEVDSAMVALEKDLEYFRDIKEMGPVVAPRVLNSASDVGITVHKRGYRTGLTKGTVHAIGGTVHLGAATFADGVIDIDPDPAIPVWQDCVESGNCAGNVSFSAFACIGDSGAAVFDDQHRIVGMFNALHCDGTAVAIGIDVVTTALGVTVLTASQAQQKQVVPLVTGVNTSAHAQNQPLNLAQYQKDLERAQQEMLATPPGPRYAEVIRQHEREIIQLVNKNRRVATVWHRNGGPVIVQNAVQALHSSDHRLPSEINGKPLTECLTSIQQIFTRYGSPQLSADLQQYGPPLLPLVGLNYPQALDALRDMRVE
ncbi:MAG: hypothetical protein WCE73_03495 [Candidatus Angelobacter sp.]